MNKENFNSYKNSLAELPVSYTSETWQQAEYQNTQSQGPVLFF
jgi:hypothetical protein